MEFRRLLATFGPGRGSALSRELYQSWIKHITIKYVKHVCSKEGLRSESYLSYHLLETVCNAWMESWVRKIARDERMIPRAVWWELIYVCLTQRENETQHQPPARLLRSLFCSLGVSWDLTQDITQCLQHSSLQVNILQQRADCLAAGYSNIVHLSVSPTFNPYASGSWNLNLETHLDWSIIGYWHWWFHFLTALH